MIGTALILAALGIFLSAFFSGAETGFYRATRTRLVLDALGGDPIARGLVWFTNNPSFFVASTLVGNNLASYLTSLAIVMGTQALVVSEGHAAELIAPMLLAPLLFVYEELLPKKMFMEAPNRLLRRSGPLLFVFFVLFLPISVLLWGLSKILAQFVGESPEQVRLTLARRELGRVLAEGHEAGILHPAQQAIARGIFAVADQPVSRLATPLRDVPRARADMSRKDILRLARRYRIAAVPVESSPVESTNADRQLIGYVRVVDLSLDESEGLAMVRPLLEIGDSDTHVAALMRMHSNGESLARVIDTDGRTIGILTAPDLRAPFFPGGKQPRA